MIVHQQIKRKMAIDLRKKNFTFQEIIKRLHVAKSTLSGWINNDLNKEEEKLIKNITAKKGLNKIIKLNKLRSLKIINDERVIQHAYAKAIKKISDRELFWLGMGLYMGEGAKTGRWRAIFYNSDPLLNKIMISFFKKICKAPEDKIHIQMILHENISEIKAREYWSNVLNIPEKQFNRASFVKSKASKNKRLINKLEYGTVQIAIGNKGVFNKIKGWVLGIKNVIFPH